MSNLLIETVLGNWNKSLYESLMLLEDRIDYLKQNNPTIDTSHDTLAKHKSASDIIDHFATHADPTKNKSHTQWILGQYKKGNIRQEDAGRIKTALTNFDRYKGKLQQKDINKYNKLSDLEDAVQPHVGTPATRKEAEHDTNIKGRTLIHSKDGLKVYRLENTPEGKQASINIYGGGHHLGGCHTSWCTAADSDENMFSHYSDDGHLYTIHTPSGKVYQVHPATGQFMDAKDEIVNVNGKDKDEEKHLNDALDNIPNGIKLKIKHNFNTVTSDEISKALDDENEDNRIAAIQHKNVTPEHINNALNDDNVFVRRSAMERHDITPEHINKALNDRDFVVRAYAIQHKNATHDQIDRALDDSSFLVREAAAKHKNATPELIKKALNDDEPHIRSIAKERLAFYRTK